MPKRTPSVLEKVSNFVKIPISLAKVPKPITLNLMFFKKRSGKVKFYRHYNHGFIQEYQFSPSNTPLVFPHNSSKEKKPRKFQSILFMCMCLGNYGVHEKEEIYPSQQSLMELMPLPSIIKNGIVSGEEEEELEMSEIDNDECSLLSVDERAEIFIEKFYAQMRVQCQDYSTNYQLSLLLCD